MISVIIPHSLESELTKEWAIAELTGLDHEIIMDDSWAEGAKKAKGEYVCFLEKDCVLGGDYFSSLLANFTDNPSFRKLAVVAPNLGVNSYKQLVYGYRLTPTSVLPSELSSSRSAHLIQIAYIPGALIRRSALGSLSVGQTDPMMDSVNLSIYFWNNGTRILLDPDVLYISTDEALKLPHQFDPIATNLADLTEMWARELVG